MKTKCRFRNLSISFFLALLLLNLGIGNFSAFAQGVSLETLTLTPTETGVSETLLPIAIDTGTITPSPLPSVTEQNTIIEIDSSSTPEPTQILDVLPKLEGDYVPDEIVVRFKPRIDTDLKANCFVGMESSIVYAQIDALNVTVLKVPEGRVSQTLARVINCSGVLYVEPNYIAYAADTIPNDPGWGNQYGLINIRAPQGWDLSTGSAAVTIAIVDTGVDISHPDLSGKVVGGYDFVNNDAVAQDDNGHGTHVAGIAAAFGNDGVGVAGVSWGARIMPVKVLNASANGSFANVAAGIIWATDHGAQIINLSLGGNSSSQVLQDAVDYAYSKGVVLVAAAGNSGSASILYPARYPNVIAVGAVDNANNRASISNYGPELDVVAPGVAIYSAVIGGYGYKSGTSMAAPYVSGLASILREYPGGYSPDGIAWILESSALDLGTAGKDNFYGAGLIQMDAAIRQVYPLPTVTPTITPTTITPTRLVETITIPSGSSSNTYSSKVIPYGINSSPTNTPTPTVTLTISPTLFAKTVLPISQTATATVSPTPTKVLVDQLGAFLAQENADTPSFLLPCLGIGFILAGLVLAQLAIRLQRNNQH